MKRFNGAEIFLLFSIPLTLALAAGYWLAFGEGLHYFRRAVSLEKRRAEIVGAAPLPVAPMEIKIKSERGMPVRITRAEIDGNAVFVYAVNDSDGSVEYVKLEWKLLSPDGTTIASEYDFSGLRFGGPHVFQPREKAEFKIKISADPRASVLFLRIYR